MKKIVIYGNSSMAEVVAEYIGNTPGYEVVAFTIDKELVSGSEFGHKRLIAIDELSDFFGKNEIELLVLTAFGQGSPRILKKQKSEELKSKGFRLSSFIDPSAYVAPSATVGENCIILNRAIVEPFAVLDDGVFLRSDAYVSHGSHIGEYSYLAPRATLAGKVEVGRFCFLGVNCTIHDRKKVGDYAIIGGGAVVTSDVPEYGVIKAAPGILLDVKSTKFDI